MLDIVARTSGDRTMESMLAAISAALALVSTSAAEPTLREPAVPRCEYLADPQGIDVARPRLSWQLAPTDANVRGVRQTAYQVLVASTAERLARHEGDRWDSGRVTRDQSVQVEYNGRPLTSGAECYWKVRVWDGAGRPSAWSRPARFSMGLLQPADWTGRWITGQAAARGEVTKLPLLRKRFRIDAPLRRAMLYVASLGYHRVELNGQKVGDHEFDPVQSDYSHRVYYVTHDVTDRLAVGDNALGVALGKGWYWQGFRGVPQDRPAVRVELVIEGRDGSRQRVASDDSWKSAIAPGQLIGGRRNAGGDFGVERYDARLEQPNWSRAGFDDSAWTPAEVLRLPPIRLCAQMIAPNRVVRCYPAVSIDEPQPGVYVLDFGTNLTGRLRMKVAGANGAEIGFQYFASHTGDRKNRTENFRQADQYLCRGGTEEEFSSQFNWRAFRFVKITGLPRRPALADAVAELISTDLPRTGTFECSDPVLNRLHELVVHTHQCITLGGIQVDCPHRERLGYGAEGQAGLAQAVYNFDAAAFYAKWARDFHDGQDPTTGMVYHTAPFRIHSGGGPAWPGACIVYPWHVYLFYGDRRALEEGYPAMRRWLACMDRLSPDDLLRPYGLPAMNLWQFLGDWAAPRRPDDTLPCNGHWTTAEQNQVFNDLHRYLQVTLVARIAAILGHADDARQYNEKAAAIRRAINRAYFDPRTGRYTRSEQQQTYLAFPLLLDVVPDEHRARVLQNLTDDIERRDGHLDFGVLGGVYTLDALVREGRSDLVYRMATRPTWPGWRWMIDQGATTLWEHWRPGDSSIHNSFLAVGGWFYRGLAGIVPDAKCPGFRHVILRPQPVPGMTWAKATLATMYGPLESGWRIDQGQLVFELQVPPGSKATVHLPARNLEAVQEHGRPAGQAEGVRAVGMQAGRAVFEIHSGRYHFTVPAVSTPLARSRERGRG
jgi:alpha-L-rhamnosidase